MTYLIAYIICAICSLCLVKSHVESTLAPHGGIVQVFRKSIDSDPEIPDEDKYGVDSSSDDLIEAVVWTGLLIACLIAWPVLIFWLVCTKVFKTDKIDFEEMHK